VYRMFFLGRNFKLISGFPCALKPKNFLKTSLKSLKLKKN